MVSYTPLNEKQTQQVSEKLLNRNIIAENQVKKRILFLS